MNKTVLITGASSGIGQATARIFAANGYRLLLNARRLEKLEQLSSELQAEFSTEIHLLPFDVSDKAAAEQAIAGLPQAWEVIDILVNNAGLALDFLPIQEGKTDSWDTMIDTNVKGLLYVSRLVTAGMARRNRGHVINIGSTAGKDVYPAGNVYCATKFAVGALSQAMRIDLLPFGIHVTLVNPGATETEFSLVRFEGDAQRAANVYRGFDPLQAVDIAETIYFAATRPAHVNIAEITITPNAQATSNIFHKN